MTSPCLSSLATACSYYTQDIADYHYEAILEIIEFVAPNLKEVSLFPAQIFSSLGPEKSRQPWRGLKLQNSDSIERQRQTSSRGSLLQLSISHFPEDLASWSNRTDFSVLRVLEIGTHPDAELFDHMATNCNFPSLKTLVLDMREPYFHLQFRQNDFEQRAQEFDRAIGRFLLSLKSLGALKLEGDIGHVTFDAMLVGHSQTLKRLHLMPRQAYRQFSLGLFKFLEIKNCTKIEELTIEVRRSRGDDMEVTSYKLLGALPRLKNLWLILDASNCALGTEYPDEEYELDDARYEEQVPNDSRFDEGDKKILPDIYLDNGIRIRRGFIRDAFVNIAVDESLARSIFTTISAGKPLGPIALERMQVCADGGFIFSNHSSHCLEGFEGLAMHMSQPWLVERNPRDDCRNELIVKSLKRYEKYYGGYDPSKEAEECFKSIWPDDGTAKRVYTDWRDWANNWVSFPLEV